MLSTHKAHLLILYWYNQDYGTIYDYDLYYAIGKVAVDDDGLAKKIDKDTYIIDQLIPIPQIEEEY